jgi:hypothetical protein
VIARADIERVARQHDLPLVVAYGLAADVAHREAIRAERRSRAAERRSNWLRLTGYIIEKEDE